MKINKSKTEGCDYDREKVDKEELNSLAFYGPLH